MERFQDFCDNVLKGIPRATKEERADIRDELTDHLLEHQDMLVDHGVDPETAERRAVEAMGDPGEIGKAWNEKLSPFWLWLGRIAKTVCIALLVLNCTTLWYFAGGAIDNLRTRTAAPAELAEQFVSKQLSLISAQELDIRREIGGQIVRIYRVELHEPDGLWSWKNLKVYMVAYAKNPFGYALNGDVLGRLTCNGERAMSAGGGSGHGESHRRAVFRVEEGMQTVRFALDHLGNSFAVDVELDWGGADA